MNQLERINLLEEEVKRMIGNNKEELLRSLGSARLNAVYGAKEAEVEELIACVERLIKINKGHA